MIEKYKELYKRTKAGNVQVWSMEQEGDKYRSISGKVGGQMIVAEWTTCFGKNIGRSNETTAEEQATLEIISKYEAKLKAGYFETLDAVDEDRGFFEPMTALKFKDKFKFAPGTIYFSQPKLDGFRCVAYPGRLQSRSGKRDFVSCPHILEALEEFFTNYPMVRLDGELYNHELKEDFDTIGSLVTKEENITDEDFQKSRELIQFHVYDCFFDDDPGATFADRSAYLSVHMPWLGDSIVCVRTDRAETVEEIDNYYEEYLNEGYEGQMIRFNTPYENKRTKYLLKRKEFIDEEYQVVQVANGKGKREHVAGRIHLVMPDGRPFKAGVKGSMSYAKRLLDEADEYVGGDCTVRYFRLTPDGIPRFPVAVALYKGKREY